MTGPLWPPKRRTKTRTLFLPPYGSTSGTLGDWRDHYPMIQLIDGQNHTAFFSFMVPDDFLSLVSVKAVWTSAAASGNMYWYLNTDYGASGEDTLAHQDEPSAGATATGGANVFNVQEPANPLTLADLAKGDYVGVKFYRLGSDPLDTLNAEVYLAGLLFTYVAED